MALAPRATVTPLAYVDEILGTIDLPTDRMIVTRGLGSGLARRKGDPAGTVWAIGDRGPNFKVAFAIRRYGVDHPRRFAGVAGAKIMPLLGVGPAISELRVDGDRVTCDRTIQLRDRKGTPLTGVPVPGGFSEPTIDRQGNAIAPDPGGADTEGIAAVSDGTFWIGDEYGPSLLHVAADGIVLARWVPEGCGDVFRGADYPIIEALPAIAARRRLNRGFEALALSEDESSLYLAFQSPLAHPDEAAHRHGRHVRLWRLNLADHAVTAEFSYPLDSAETFRRDGELGEVRRCDLKVSELVTLPGDRLLVLERGSATTKLQVVDLGAADAVDAAYRDVATRPTLEQLSARDEPAPRLPCLVKTLLLSTDDHPEIGADIEGIAALSPCSFVLVNDNDFGVDGVATRFWRIDFTAPPGAASRRRRSIAQPA